ncbi:MAG: LysM peptidoglycan-binding domain-containing protein [Pseudomonadota bacterium]
MTMTDALRTITVAPNETLSRIAAREGFTVKEILAVNPKIRNPNVLAIGQRINIPASRKETRYKKPEKFEMTVRFVNSWDVPPIGIRYELLDGKRSLVKGTILLDNEAAFTVADGTTVTFMARQIGDSALRRVGTFVARREHPLVIARINSFKLPSFTEPHPKGHEPASPRKASPPPTPASAPKKDQGMPNQQAINAGGAAEHQILPGECACGRDLTIDELAAIFPTRKKADLSPFLDPLNSMLKTYGIDSCLRKAHALAQIGHESGSLQFRAEKLKKGVKESDVYDGYKGRGLMQLTYRKNYVAYGKFKGVDFTGDNRTKLESYEYATDSAGWYWRHGKGFDLNKYADLNDLIYVSALINGAFNGFQHRAHNFVQAHKVLKASKCKTEANRSATYLPFERSKAYDNRDMAFGWGLWSDPDSTKAGLKKDLEASKAGYRRFLELNATNPIKKPRFGFSKTDDMIKRAQEKSK